MSDTSLDVLIVDAQSQARVGLKSNALGFPLSALTYSHKSTAEAFAQRVLDRNSALINRPIQITANVSTDPGWLPILARLDTGSSMVVRRTGLGVDDLEFECVVVGIEHNIIADPFEWSAIIQLTTTEKTL